MNIKRKPERSRKVYIILLFFFSYPFIILAQDKKTEGTKKLKNIVFYLSSDSLEGRAAGSDGEEKAQSYLLNYFKYLSPVNQSHIQDFTFLKDSNQVDTAYNLIGFIDNKAGSTVIIGAHYDHIGMGGAKSRSLTSNKIHNGADDNASGVAMLLLLAEHLKQSGPAKVNFLFIAFSAHENGLYGSKAFIDEKVYDLSKVKLMLNLDMVGRLDTINPLLMVIRNDRESYLDTLFKSTQHNKFQLAISENRLSRTDASAFLEKNIPAITFTTGIHDDYHKVSDDAEKINYNGLYEITLFVEKFLIYFSSGNKDPEHLK